MAERCGRVVQLQVDSRHALLLPLAGEGGPAKPGRMRGAANPNPALRRRAFRPRELADYIASWAGAASALIRPSLTRGPPSPTSGRRSRASPGFDSGHDWEIAIGLHGGALREGGLKSRTALCAHHRRGFRLEVESRGALLLPLAGEGGLAKRGWMRGAATPIHLSIAAPADRARRRIALQRSLGRKAPSSDPR